MKITTQNAPDIHVTVTITTTTTKNQLNIELQWCDAFEAFSPVNQPNVWFDIWNGNSIFPLDKLFYSKRFNYMHVYMCLRVLLSFVDPIHIIEILQSWTFDKVSFYWTSNVIMKFAQVFGKWLSKSKVNVIAWLIDTFISKPTNIEMSRHFSIIELILPIFWIYFYGSTA